MIEWYKRLYVYSVLTVNTVIIHFEFLLPVNSSFQLNEIKLFFEMESIWWNGKDNLMNGAAEMENWVGYGRSSAKAGSPQKRQAPHLTYLFIHKFHSQEKRASNQFHLFSNPISFFFSSTKKREEMEQQLNKLRIDGCGLNWVILVGGYGPAAPLRISIPFQRSQQLLFHFSFFALCSIQPATSWRKERATHQTHSFIHSSFID